MGGPGVETSTSTGASVCLLSDQRLGYQLADRYKKTADTG
jgi:hypothetical protein